MALTVTIGNLLVNVIGNTSRFVQSMRNGRRENNRFRESIDATKKAASSVNKVLAVVGVTYSASALIGKFNATRDSIDRLGKTAEKLGATTDALASLRFAGEQTGVAANTMDMAMQRMTRRVAEAAKGTGEAKDALKELRLDARRLAAMPLDKQFIAIAGAMDKVEGQGNRVRLAFKLFDSEGVALVNTLALGERGLRDMAQQARELGIALKDEDVNRVEAMNDAINRLKHSFGGVGSQLVIGIAPRAERTVDALTEAMRGLSAGGGGEYLNKLFVGNKVFGQLGRLIEQTVVKPLSKAAVKMDIAAGRAMSSGPLREFTVNQGFNPQRPVGPSDLRIRERMARIDEMLSRAEARMLGGEAPNARAAKRAAAHYLWKGIHGIESGIRSGVESLGGLAERANAAMSELERRGRAFAADWWLKKLFGPWAGGRPRTEPEQQTSTDVYRSINEALEKGTAAAYTAARANLLPKMQLDEARKQTSLLAKIERHAQGGGVTLQAVGIG